MYRDDKSPYEGAIDDKLDGKTCFARITGVDADLRRCDAVSLGRANGGTDDLDLRGVQWINLSATIDGDEDTILPVIGSYGVVIFIGNEPYILGYYKPIPDSGDQPPQENLALNPGDKVFKTAGGNRITLRAGGTIEVQSTDLCRTYYIPSRNLITHVCQEMELETDGGSIDWTRDRDTQETLYHAEYFDNLEPETMVVEERGSASDGESVFTTTIGPYDPVGGDVLLPTYAETIAADGSYSEKIGEEFEYNVDAGTGEAFLKASKLQFGSDSSDEPVVLGKVLKEYLTALEGQVEALQGQVNAIVTALTTFSAGLVTVPPPIGAAITAKGVALGVALVPVTAQLTLIKTQLGLDKTEFIDTDATNILSGLAFSERGLPL